MLAAISPAAAERVPIVEAAGRVLAEDIAVARDLPPFAASAMDGWAVQAADTPGRLRIIGESAAGRGFAGAVKAGQAVRIFTGASLPARSDAVVMQEDAQSGDVWVTVPQTAPGRHVRPAGGDLKAGEILLRQGMRLDAWRISLAAAAGRAEAEVRARPRVAILSTGDELVQAPAPPKPHQIYESNAPALAVMAEGWGARAIRIGPLPDELEAVAGAMRRADAELLVTIGGASVGDYDLVRQAAGSLGLVMSVESIDMRPGKPTFFGTFADGRRLLGLPGNPASAFICAELFLKPILYAWQGADPAVVMSLARTQAPLAGNGPREHWMRAALGQANGTSTVRPFADQDSFSIRVFAAADALIRRPANAPPAAVGDPVEVLALARA
jgi:molybdopterin molybdotransferase